MSSGKVLKGSESLGGTHPVLPEITSFGSERQHDVLGSISPVERRASSGVDGSRNRAIGVFGAVNCCESLGGGPRAGHLLVVVGGRRKINGPSPWREP